jgi:hypothetical protein
MHYRLKTVPVGTGGDRLYALDPRIHHSGVYFAAALDILRTNVGEGETLAVFPDGSLLNYLLRSPNPTPYYLLTPWEMKAFGGEDAVFARIAPDPPDYFVLTRLDMSEYGPAHFGYDARYGQRLRLWVEQNYDVVADVGEEPHTRLPWLSIYKLRAGRAASTRLPAGSTGS